MSNNIPVLELSEVFKNFGGVQALKGVHFSLKKGEIHAIVGENGAGKSTLMNIIGGNITPTSGEIRLNGKPVKFNNAADAQKHNITFIHQELTVYPKMDIRSNIFIENYAQHNKLSLLKDKTVTEKSREILKKVKLDISPHTSLETLGMGQRQMIEISRMFTRDTEILVLDEPTSSLTDKEIAILFDFIRELSNKGVAIIYISHKLEEIFAIAHRITVLRDGQSVGTFQTSDLDQRKLVELMIGTEISSRFPKKAHRVLDQTVMAITGFSSKKRFSDVSMSIRKGEVLGITGLLGAGRTELARCIFGLDKKLGGQLFIEGKEVKISSPNAAIKNGIGFVTENRGEEGLVIQKSIKENVVLAELKKFTKAIMFFNKKEQNKVAIKMRQMLNIKSDSVEQLVCNLSGGNQQKVVLAKWIVNQPKVLILDEPTRGIDIGAKHEIYKLIDQLADEGMAVLFISSEIPEILGVCDTVMVMHKGKLGEKKKIQEVSQKDLMLMAQGENVNG